MYMYSLGPVTKNETYQPVGTFRGGWYVYMIFHGVISQQNVLTSRNVRTFRNELSFVAKTPEVCYKKRNVPTGGYVLWRLVH